MLHQPFVMYADLESVLVKLNGEEGADEESWTIRTHHVTDIFSVNTQSTDVLTRERTALSDSLMFWPKQLR